MVDFTEQGVPIDPTCPQCDGEPEYDPMHQLSMAGYPHDDISFTCEECEHTWVHGVPIGDNTSKLAEELTCGVCKDGEFRVHRIEFADDEHGVRALRLHLKCPECYHFRGWERDVESGQRTVLVGHPSTTGDVNEGETTTTYHEKEI